jgi:hypothetical protein
MEEGGFISAPAGPRVSELTFDGAPCSSGTSPGARGYGIGIAVGYGFSPRFRGELSLGGSWRETKPEEGIAGSGVARFTGYIPFRTGRRFQPHLIAGFNGSFAAFSRQDDEPILAYFMAGGELGAGFRLTAGRHWALQYDYINSVLDLAQEFFSDEDDQETTKYVGRRGRAESLRFSLVYDF